jgi:phenylalanyl-tRNA synthetase beta chain
MLILHDWLKDYCGEWLPDVPTIEELFTFHAFEVEGTSVVGEHTVIDVKVLPDRASDSLSHRGIARELSTLTGKPLAHDPFVNPVELSPKVENIKVTITNPSQCRRFALAHMTGITIGESPAWLKSRLSALGQRSINNVVDATNYVMLSLGQPLHAYDAKKLAHDNGEWHFHVRMARAGEEITTLTNDTYTLPDTIQLIVDGWTDTPAGIAGIKGGKLAEVDAQTTDIIIEAANFDPQVTRKASQALKLQTDASKRFENSLSPELVVYALTDIVSLIQDIAGGTCEGYFDTYPTPIANAPVAVTLAHIHGLLGVHLADAGIEEILNRLGFLHSRTEHGWEVVAPFERMDIVIPEDVIAEVGRVYGYEHVESVIPEKVALIEYNAKQYYSEKIRTVLVERGFSEVITSSFMKKDIIELQNALASDKGCLRSSLARNIREVLDRNMPNIDLLGLQAVRVFEVGTVFEKNDAGDDVVEHVSLALGVRTKQQGYTPKDDVVLGETVSAIEEMIGMSLNGTTKEGVFECNLSSLISKLPIPTAYDAYTPLEDVLFAPYSAYPFISRDIALWVPESISQDAVEEIIKENGGELLTTCRLFDEFKKEGRVSYAFRLIFQSFERTLTDDEVGRIMDSVTDVLKGKGFEVR